MSYIIKHVTIKRKNTRDAEERSTVRRKNTPGDKDFAHKINEAVIETTTKTTNSIDSSSRLEKGGDLEKNRVWLLKFLSVILFFAVGVAFYHFQQGWPVTTCFYFIIVSMTTVGYGDISPSDDWARLFTIFFILFGLVFVFSIINDAIQSFLDHLESQAMEKLDDDNAVQSNHTVKIGISIAVILLFLMLGTLFYSYNEGWTFIQGLYWTCMTVSTVGYGDLELTKFSSKIFSIFYIVLAVVLMTTAIGNFAAVQMEIAHEKKKLSMLNTKLDIEAIRAMDTDGKGVDEMAFVTAMLVQICGLDKEKDIDPWRARFRELDKDDSKFLDEEDLRLLEQEEEKKRQERLAAFRRKSATDTHAIFGNSPNKHGNSGSSPASSPVRSVPETNFFEPIVCIWNRIKQGMSKKSRPTARKVAVVQVRPGQSEPHFRDQAEMKAEFQV